jgi:hypothetical protein
LAGMPPWPSPTSGLLQNASMIRIARSALAGLNWFAEPS